MVWKVGKTLKNFLYAGAFVTAASILPGCEKPELPEPPQPSIKKSIEQTVELSNDVEIKYSATLSNVDKAQLNIKKEGVQISTEQISDVTSTGLDYQKTYTYTANPNITKGNYEFILTAEDLQKNNSIQIQNYKPTGNFSGINLNIQYNSEVDVTLPTPSDKNPEDNPVHFVNVKSLDDKTSVVLNGNNLKVKAISGNTGNYQIELEYGSTAGGLEKSVLNGNIAGKPKIIVNPFVQPNDSTLNWYGSGDVDNNNTRNSKDLDRMIEIINGIYSNPTDKRLYDRADVNGDEKVNSEDLDILTKRINGVRLYLPGEWSLLMLPQERKDWFNKMAAIDNSDERVFPGGSCVQHEQQAYINFHGVETKDIPKFLNVYPYDFSNNGRFNLPLLEVMIVYFDSEGKPLSQGHAMNTIIIGKKISIWEDLFNFEPQFSHTGVQVGEDYLNWADIIFEIRGFPLISWDGIINMEPYFVYSIKNNIPAIIPFENQDIKLITERSN